MLTPPRTRSPPSKAGGNAAKIFSRCNCTLSQTDRPAVNCGQAPSSQFHGALKCSVPHGTANCTACCAEQGIPCAERSAALRGAVSGPSGHPANESNEIGFPLTALPLSQIRFLTFATVATSPARHPSPPTRSRDTRDSDFRECRD